MDAGCRSTRRCARWSATAPRTCSPATSSRSPIPTTWTSASSRCSACSPVRSLSTSWTSATSIATATRLGPPHRLDRPPRRRHRPLLHRPDPRHHRTPAGRAGAARQRGALPAHRRTRPRGHLDDRRRRADHLRQRPDGRDARLLRRRDARPAPVRVHGRGLVACRRRQPRPAPAGHIRAGWTSSSAAATAASCGRTWRPARSSPTTAATRERSPSSTTSPPARAPKPSWAGWPATTR